MEDIYEKVTDEININSIDIKIYDKNLMKINKKYILIREDKSILIYDFCQNLFLDDKVDFGANIDYFDFHTKNDNLFFLGSEKKIKLYEINNKKINEITNFETLSDNIFYGCFNSLESNKFLSASRKGLIKIYDIAISSLIGLIDLKESLEHVYKIKFNKKYIGYIKGICLTYFEYYNFKNENIKKYISQDISDFHFLDENNDSLVIINKNNFEIIENNKNIKTCDGIINDSFYFRKDKILIIINKKTISGIKINDNYQISYPFKFKQDTEYYISKPFFINENYLNPNEICGMYKIIDENQLLSYLIIDNTILQTIKNDNDKIDVKKIKKIISDIPLLISKENNENNFTDLPDNPNNKNYFKINIIKKELNEVKKRSLLERKKKVEKEFINYNNNKNIDEKYIFLLKLLINDNTNKNVLETYLTLIKEKGEELKDSFKDNFEEFKNEFNLFSKVFSDKDNLSIFHIEVKSLKTEFINFLNRISSLKEYDENDIIKFENDLKESNKYLENVSYFNMPINISNEQLFYYKNINVIKNYLKNVYEIINKNIKKESKKIRDGKSEVIKDKKKNLLKFELDKISSNIKLCIDNFRNSKDYNILNELIIALYFAPDKELFSVCYKYILYSNRNITNILNQNPNNKYIEELFKLFKKREIEFNLIKKFYKNILPLKCFKSIFLTLNGKDSYYPFDDKEFVDYFVENNFEILDVPICCSVALTDKFTMKTYFIPFMSDTIFSNNMHFNNKINIAMIHGFFVKAGNHEIGHNFTNINFYMENSKIPIITPRKKNFDYEEGGYYIDLALFGRILKNINLQQVLYILNEKNYDKTYLDFQYDFNNIKSEDLEVEGVFKEMCKNISKDINNDLENNAKSIYVRLNPFNVGETKIDCSIRNDVIFGRIISDEEYESILMKYGDN